MFVKICGLRTEADVAAAVDAGADAVGFVLTESVRQVDPVRVAELVAGLPPHVLSVAVIGTQAGPSVTAAAESGVRAVQLHGPHPRSAFAEVLATGRLLIRATAAAEAPDARCGDHGEDMLILDSATPGSGQSWDWAALDAGFPRGQWLLAGGLHPGNVAAAIDAARPWGVDVSSGVERSRGVKDPARIADFVAAARAA